MSELAHVSLSVTLSFLLSCCVIYNNVTLGMKEVDKNTRNGTPRVDSNRIDECPPETRTTPPPQSSTNDSVNMEAALGHQKTQIE